MLTKIKFLLPLTVDISTIRLYLYAYTLNMSNEEALQQINELKERIEKLQKKLDAINESNLKKLKE